MAEVQSEVKACIDCTEDFLAASCNSAEVDIDGFVDKSYTTFLQRAWHDLPVSSADGSALATVSCMSLWELLNEYTSSCDSSAERRKGLAVQVLTTMYPKSKDRRCAFQQLNSCGNGAQTAVPLNTPIPLESSYFVIPPSNIGKEYLDVMQKISKIARLGSYINGKETSIISELLRNLVTNVLPKCVFVDGSATQPTPHASGITIVLKDANNGWDSGFIFLSALWDALVVGEFLGLAEAKELAAFLRSSRWASQIVSIGGRRVAYSSILASLVDICTLCLSLNLRAPSTSVDTTPLVDPRVVQLLCGHGSETISSIPAKRAGLADTQNRITELTNSLMEKKAALVKEQLNETIPNEMEFMGFSSSCRDFDQLAYLCRDLLFLPSAELSQTKQIAQSRNRDLLFGRKRGRGGTDYDGPCFIPVKSSLSAVMEKSNAEAHVPLERLCYKWSRE